MNKKTNAKSKGNNKRNAKRVNALSIYEKLFNLQQNVSPVLKTGKNTHHKYDYTKEIDIIAEVKPVLKEQRLTYFFTTKEGTVEADPKKRKLLVTFTLVNVDKPSETIVTDVVGEGENKEGSVVGVPVAYTMALKYYFAKLCMLETGTDAEFQEIEKARKGKKNEGKDDRPADPAVEYEKHVKIIKSSRNIGGLIEFSDKLKDSKFYNAEQKKSLQDLVTARVAELENAK